MCESNPPVDAFYNEDEKKMLEERKMKEMELIEKKIR